MLDPARNGFGEFLRSRRGRLTPEAAGITSTRRRRTLGLRREEVAELAGVGVDWYTRLEQGRMVNPSQMTVDSLARALRLNKAEHAHLRALARNPARGAFVREAVPDTLRRIVESLNQPAFVKGRRWDVLAWNAAAAEAFTDFGTLNEEDRNLLVFIFTNPDARRLFGKAWSEEARHALAQFRLGYDLWAGDPAFETLVDRLRRDSAEFDLWWKTHDIRSAATGRKVFHHRGGGAASYAYATFQAIDDPALKLVIYAPEDGTPARRQRRSRRC
jgi:transcriptional regulator with XRE-family HTH domain